MDSADEPRLQLLVLSKDPAHMMSVMAMLHSHGIQTVRELTSLAWRSAGFESFVMVSTEDYPKASALFLEMKLAVGLTGASPPIAARLDEAWQAKTP